MADTTTTTYSLTKPEVGASADTWGTKLNTNFDTIDDLLDGTTAISPNLSTLTIGGTAVTSTATELNYVDGVTSNIQTQIDNISTELVNDTTPQLGGTLDTNSNPINDASGVDLQYNGTTKLSTTNAGVWITTTGTSDNLVVESSDDGSSNAPDLVLYRNSSTPANNDNLGSIVFKGKNSAGTDQNFAFMQGILDDATSGSEDGFFQFYNMRAGTHVEGFRMNYNGDFHADGDVIAYSTTVSDERLKENIQPIDDALAKVKQLKGCTFTYTEDGKDSAGLIAQDVEKVLPSAVTEKELPLKKDDGIAYKTVQYDQTIGLLVEAIKELTAKVEELENR